ncbi:tetratricopeptide repeat protein [Gimesia sp.]|uniref:tetratricopeptide repeat protein n=1 Tax=Gimesia sp. TaxID=2024833 RepID=UPI003A915FDA
MKWESFSKQIRSQKLMFAVVVVFAVLCSARLTELIMYNPDSADYVIMARGLITDFEYRQVYSPGEPYFTLRPPGMSLLLIPAALIAPYDVIMAKVTVLITAVLMLILFYGLMCRLKDSDSAPDLPQQNRIHWPELLLALLLATNPYILLYSTLLMSEVPFTACTLAVLYLVTRRDTETISKRQMFLLTGLLMFLPLLRTIGISLVLALGLWSITNRKRWPYLLSVFCSLGVTAAWMFRNSAHQSVSYSSVLIEEYKKVGLPGMLVSMVNRILTHFEGLCQKIIPGMPGEFPEYERAVLNDNFVLPGPPVIYLLVSLLVISIAVYGMLKKWNRGGAVSFYYILFTFLILSIWPWLQLRFTLPLLPILLAYVPSGITAFGASAKLLAVGGQRVLAGALILGCVLLGISQVGTDLRMVYANQKLISMGESFYETEYPGHNFCNFVAAGRWIRKHSEPVDRVLTRRTDTAISSHRFQSLAHLEQYNVEQLHELIQSFSAKYLVCYDRNYVGAFKWYLLDSDPVYRLTPVYTQEGVMVIEVQPNYEGTVRHQYWREEESMEIARKAYEKNPDQLSCQIGYLDQLQAAQKYQEAIKLAESLQKKQIQDVRIVCLLGWAYAGNKQYEQAMDEFRKAALLPNAKLHRRNIQRGYQYAQKLSALKNESEKPETENSPEKTLQIAENYWKLARYEQAMKNVQKVLASQAATAEDRDTARILAARLYLRNGQSEQALSELKKIKDSENKTASTLETLIQQEQYLNEYFAGQGRSQEFQNQRLESGIRESLLKLVAIYESEGVPGKALRLLERAHELDPNDSGIRKQLAKFQLFYQQFSKAEENYLILKQQFPKDQEIQDSLSKIEQIKVLPRF